MATEVTGTEFGLMFYPRAKQLSPLLVKYQDAENMDMMLDSLKTAPSLWRVTEVDWKAKTIKVEVVG